MAKRKNTPSAVPSPSLDISIRRFDSRLRADVLIIPVTKSKGRIQVSPNIHLSKSIEQRLRELVAQSNGFGAVGAVDQQALPSSENFKRILLVNLGESRAVKLNDVRLAAAIVCDACSKGHWKSAVLMADVALQSALQPKTGALAFIHAWVEGMCLGRFRFTARKATNGENGVANGLNEFVIAASERPSREFMKAVERAQIGAEAANLARYLGHEPPNIINPVTLADRCTEIARTYGLACRVLDERYFVKHKMGGILAVGDGSSTRPRIIILEHAGRSAKSKPLVLIGKAVTHDTGGYSIKPATSLPDMKYDKCGGMAVMSTMVAAAQLKLSQRVVGILGAAENMISGTAYRAGDIIRMGSGKTVEVVNTDAEGRIVLGDCLYLAEKMFRPAAMIDLATLTGACDVALGSGCAGLMANNQRLAQNLVTSGERTNERLWELPLWPVYREQIIGGDADIKNAGGRGAGAITAGMFLKEFISDKTPWAHLDIAGTARTDKSTPLCPVGATGFGVRLLLDFLQSRE